MYILKSDSTDAYFNIALEEFLLTNYDHDFFIVAVNETSIIVGVNQNTYDEINAIYVKQNSVKVVRRLSGGGTVFQDKGNINYSFISKDDGSDIDDFSAICNLILKFLKEKFDFKAEFAGRNELVFKGKKFSGNAKLKINDKILHHGTLLFDSNMKFLLDALKLNPNKHTDRALRSNHEKVTNIHNHLEEKNTIEKIQDLFLNFVRNEYPDAKPFELSNEDKEKVNKLVEEKYSQWSWNFGEETKFDIKKTLTSKVANLDSLISLDEENRIKSIRIFGDFFSQKSISDIEDKLIGCKFVKSEVKNKLIEFDFSCYMSGISIDDFITKLFEK
jgi:lipoate-protein ligase A